MCYKLCSFIFVLNRYFFEEINVYKIGVISLYAILGYNIYN